MNRETALKCDWCGIDEQLAADQETKSNWVRMQVYQLVHSEPARIWHLCPYCWSVVEGRRCDIRAEAIGAKRLSQIDGTPFPDSLVETSKK